MLLNLTEVSRICIGTNWKVLPTVMSTTAMFDCPRVLCSKIFSITWEKWIELRNSRHVKVCMNNVLVNERPIKWSKNPCIWNIFQGHYTPIPLSTCHDLAAVDYFLTQAGVLETFKHMLAGVLMPKPAGFLLGTHSLTLKGGTAGSADKVIEKHYNLVSNF